jgi:hypothetical protein
VRAYTECLGEPDLGPELAEDAKSNLALARALLQKARARKSSQQESPDEHEPDPSPPDNPPRNRQQPGDYAVGPQGRELNGVPTPGPQVGREQRPGAVETSQTAPGEGHQPPVPDQDQVAKMSAEDTEEYVREAAKRILREQREQWRRSAALPRPGMKDW